MRPLCFRVWPTFKFFKLQSHAADLAHTMKSFRFNSLTGAIVQMKLTSEKFVKFCEIMTTDYSFTWMLKMWDERSIKLKFWQYRIDIIPNRIRCFRLTFSRSIPSQQLSKIRLELVLSCCSWIPSPTTLYLQSVQSRREPAGRNRGKQSPNSLG